MFFDSVLFNNFKLILMKKILFTFVPIFGIFFVLVFSDFRLVSDDNQKDNATVNSNPKIRPHEVYNDVNPNLKTPPFVYYPPLPDNPLTYNNVDITNNTAPQNEPSVRISHYNPNLVVAGWRDFRLGYNPAVRRVGYSRSTDGGTTWAAVQLLDSTLLGGALYRNSDASVAADMLGNFYITTIALNNSNSNLTLPIYKSTDGGVTFPIGHILAQGEEEDKEMCACDVTPGSPHLNNVYVVWDRLDLSPVVHLVRSTDGGTTWSSPVTISGTGSLDGIGADVCVGAFGDVYTVYNGGSGVDNQDFCKSTDGGLTFSSPYAVGSGPSPNIPYSQSGYTAFPSIAADISGGARNGWVYVAWCDNTYGESDVFVSHSTDRGSTWSSRVKVNNDANGNGKCHAWPWIAVDNSGRIAVNFYSSQNTANNNTIEAWLGTSTDGGATFTAQVMSTQQSPTNEPNSDVRFGDYIGIDFWNTRITPVWNDERAGGYDMEIYTAVIVDTLITAIHPITSNIPSGFELRQNYPNPFNPATVISFDLPKTGNIDLAVYDTKGQLVDQIYRGQMNYGQHQISWDGSRFSSGVYFYRLNANGFSETKKMILVK